MSRLEIKNNIEHQTSDIRPRLISMIHFLEERGKESERDNRELKDFVKELRDTHKQDMQNQSNLMESIEKLTNQVAELSEQNKVLEQEVDNLLSQYQTAKYDRRKTII